MAARAAPEVVAETAERRVVLLENHCLSLNFTDLLGYDS
jgi:hypothetical protein